MWSKKKEYLCHVLILSSGVHILEKKLLLKFLCGCQDLFFLFILFFIESFQLLYQFKKWRDMLSFDKTLPWSAYKRL